MFEGMSDDQIAVIGCGVAFFVCMGLMIVSHSLRQMVRPKSTPDVSPTAGRMLPPAATNRQAGDDRKAA